MGNGVFTFTKDKIKKAISDFHIYKNSHGKYRCFNRSKGCKYVCIILAGYKEILWDSVFPRIKAYVMEDIDVCVVSSGLYNQRLFDICEKYEWTYISVGRNNLCLAQNLAIMMHPNAEYVYKLDEDMFVTKEFFQAMRITYQIVSEEGRFAPGFVAPLIPINGYSYIQLLNKWGRLSEYESKFGKAMYTGGNNDASNFTKNPEIPIYFWRDVPELKDLDLASEELAKAKFTYSVCPFRFSIGAIYFKKSLWLEMGMFDVNHTTGMALDEIKLCAYCNTNSLAIIVSENCIVGHLAYGPQMYTMIEYYCENKDQFKLNSGRKVE